VVLNGANDAPIILATPVFQGVTEDIPFQARSSGQMTATDLDATARLTWSILGGAPRPAEYEVGLDNFRILRNGTLFFEDGFGDGVPPPQAPDFPVGGAAAYGVNGMIAEAGGRAILSSAEAVPLQGVGTADPIIGQAARLLTNIDPNDFVRGLKFDDSFTVEARFDLTLPDAFRES
jgi:hypothetical protein